MNTYVEYKAAVTTFLLINKIDYHKVQKAQRAEVARVRQLISLLIESVDNN